MRAKNFLDEEQREEDRQWRAERRAREERRRVLERSLREQPNATQGVRISDRRKAEWLAAMRWRRQIQSVCTPSGLTFAQWLLLDSVRQLIAETEDAVIQAEIAARLELDQATISELTRRLEGKQLLSRGGDITGKAWRVYLTDKAEQLLAELDARVETASANRD